MPSSLLRKGSRLRVRDGKELIMSVERDIVDELDGVLANIRRAEQNIIGKDSSDKLKVVSRLVDLEETIKSIKNDITIPTLEITEHTLIEELQREKMLSVRVGNSLRRDGCKTVGDITNHTAYEISIMRNMGKKGADEVIEFLRLNGLSPKQGSEQKSE
jgi:DNA-directed RNA polymerase alpha subunit